MSEWYWRCVLCAQDVQKGTNHTCPVIDEAVKPIVRAPRTPWAPVTFPPQSVPKE